MYTILSHPKITSGLKSLQSKVAYKLLFVSVTSMALPRIYIDSKRNKYAGQETAFYESYSLVTNYGLPGLLALGTAHALKGVKNPLKVDPTGWVANESVQTLSDIYQQSIEEKSPATTRDRFVTKTLENLEGIDSVSGKAVRLSPEAVKNQATRIQQWIAEEKPNEKTRQHIAKEIAESLGTFDRISLLGENRLAILPEKLLDHLRYLGAEFQKGHKSSGDIKNNVINIAEKLQFANNAKAAVSLSALAVIGFSAQFINKWITQRRTGKTGFVGYSDFGKDDPSKNKQSDNNSKTAAYSPSSPYFGGLASQQFLPTAEQLKYVIYPAGIIGKLFASRCLDEARETALKASFAYFNFLFIPNFVENLVAHLLGNKNVFSKLPQAQKAAEGNWFEKSKNYLQHINQSAIRSYEDIEVYAKRLGEEFSTLNESQLKEKLKGIVRKLDPVLQGLDKLSKEEKAERVAKAVVKELNGVKNMATVSSLLYSCLTLGIGLNLLNAYITNRKRAKAASAPISAKPAPAVPTTPFRPFSARSPFGPAFPGAAFAQPAVASYSTPNPFYYNQPTERIS